MFEKRVSQSERRIRNRHVTSMRTGTPLGSNSNCQVYIYIYTLALESAHAPKACMHMTIVLNYVINVIVLIQQCQEILRKIPDLFQAGAREGLGMRLNKLGNWN